MIINGQRYEVEPAVKAYIKDLRAKVEFWCKLHEEVVDVNTQYEETFKAIKAENKQKGELLELYRQESHQMFEDNQRLEQNNKDLQEEFCKQGAKIDELKKENARLEEGYQKSLGVIAATDCEECKNKVYRKAYNDVMKIRANIQEIIEDVRKNNGGADNCPNCGAKMDGESE